MNIELQTLPKKYFKIKYFRFFDQESAYFEINMWIQRNRVNFIKTISYKPNKSALMLYR